MSIQDTIEKLVDAKIAKAAQGGTQSVLAEYKGTDSQGKGWVVIAGSTESTPVTRATVEASEGDTVSVTIGDGKCVMDANISNPSAGIAGVKKASQTAQQALEDANTAVTYSAIASDAAAAAKVSAEDAQQTADSVHGLAEQALNDATVASAAAATAQAAAEDAQDSLMSVVSGATTVEKAVSVMQTALEAVVDYDPTTDTTQEWFWHDANGAHVLGDTSGYRNDITSSGMDIKTVADERSVAQFGASGARIGRDYDAQASDNESHMELDYHSLQLVDKNGDTYFHVSDLRDASGIAQLTEYLTSDGSNSVEVSQGIVSVISVTINLVETSDYVVDPGWIRRIIFSTAPSAGSNIAVTYTTDSTLTKAYTFGRRDRYATIGAYSCAEGYESAASGMYSHAEGTMSEASGYGAHSEGVYTKANGKASHSEGVSTQANADFSHAEGDETYANGIASHSEGYGVFAKGDYSHAGGYACVADGKYSFAHGFGCFARSESQTVIGKWNIDDYDNTYALIIGNGNPGQSALAVLSNALTVDWSGNVDAGRVTAVSDNIDRDGADPSAYVTGNSMAFRDKDGESIGLIRPGRNASGREDLQISVRNENNGTQVENNITLQVAKDGTCSYAVTDAAAFRDAIDAALKNYNASGTNAAYIRTSDSDANRLHIGFDMTNERVIVDAYEGGAWHGRLPIALWNGAANRVLATPNGSAGGTSFRALVAADIPWVGDREAKDQSSDVSVANATWVAIASVTLGAGTWVLNGNVLFASNATGRRQACIHTASPTTAAQRQCGATCNATNGIWTVLNLAGSKTPTASTTYTLYAYQNSGAALNCTGYIAATRIK